MADYDEMLAARRVQLQQAIDAAQAILAQIGNISDAVTTTGQNKAAAAASAADAKGAADAFLGDVSSSRKVRRLFQLFNRSTSDGVLRWVDRAGRVFARFDPARGWRLFMEAGSIDLRALSLSAIRGAFLARALAVRQREDLSGRLDWLDKFGRVFFRFERDGTYRGTPAVESFGGAAPFSATGRRAVGAALTTLIPASHRQRTVDGRPRIASISGEGIETLLSTGIASDWLTSVRGTCLAITSDRNDGTEAAVERAYLMTPDGRSVMRQAADRRVLIFVGMGESLMDGGVGGAIPVPGPRAIGTAMMMNGGVRLDNPDSTATVVSPASYEALSPLTEAEKQTFMGPLAFRLWHQHGLRSISINVGVSGQRYQAVKKGTNPYANGIAALGAAIALVRSLGLDPVPHMVFGMGVNDSGAGGDFRFMQPLMREILADFTADCRALLGNVNHQPRMYYWTPSSSGGSATGSWTVGGMAEMSREPFMHYVGPLTGIAYSDRHHPTGMGQAIIGDCLIYRAVRDTTVQGGTWTPLRPVAGSAVRAGTTLTFQLEGFVGGVRYLADDAAPAQSNWGVQVFTSAGVEVAVNAIALDVNTAGKVVLTLASDPGANAIVTGALVAPGSTNAPADQARTNLADNDPLTSTIDGRSFPKRLGQFRLIAA